MSDGRIKVAILGGGLGGTTAAYYLSNTPELRQRFEVTVYQQGWRLGGKAASGRDREHGDRILEHGLHMLMGFYENTFTMMREVYNDWAVTPQNPFQTWTDAFSPRSRVTLQEHVDGQYKTWNLVLPPRPGTPGDGGAPIDVIDYIERLLAWILEGLQDAFADRMRHLARPIGGTSWPDWLRGCVDRMGAIVRLPGELVVDLMPPTVTAIWRLLEGPVAAPEPTPPEAERGLLHLVEELVEWAEHVFEALGSDLADDLRRLYVLTRVGLAVVRGLVVDVLPYGRLGFDRINGEDFKAWIARHGADTEDLYFSAPVRALYDLAFAWMDGRADSPDDAQLAAGAALYSFLQLGLGYKGAPLWEMHAGMGDTIFSPLYEVCRGNGVDFQFFHRVTHLGLSATGRSIERIELMRQADIVPDTHGDPQDYAPLYDVKGLPCWPSTPLWDQLVDGARLRSDGVDFESAWCDEHVGHTTLQMGDDFDVVVLAIPPGALPLIAGELVDRNEQWRTYLDNAPTVATTSVQLWLEPDLEGLGWTHGPTTMTAYAHPLESWGEMSHLLATENWPTDKPRPHSIEYFCSALEAPAVLPSPSNPDYPAEQKEAVKQLAIEWFRNHTGHLWPDATQTGDPEALDWDKLIDWDARTGVARFDFQYWRANVDPSERYVLTPPGTVRFRLRADGSGLYNLYLAGDWVVTRINGGSAEAAVQGGMLAAQAIGGQPTVIFDPPPTP